MIFVIIAVALTAFVPVVFTIMSGTPTAMYAVSSALACLLFFTAIFIGKKVATDSAVDKGIVAITLSWYTVYWAVRHGLGFSDESIILADYIIAVMPLAQALASYIASRSSTIKPYRAALIISAGISVCWYSAATMSTANEVVLVLAVWLSALSEYRNKESNSIKALIYGLTWYQATFVVSVFLKSPIWDTYWLQIIGMTPYICGLTYVLLSIWRGYYRGGGHRAAN